ncbi:MAG TPA: formylglycine-generating enzyme family protein [Caldimonas sp.]|jgi:formylglycine-generating enzyme required for sulfatase activity|nr:formylglycine-generating enzyme family protein [Caldimonas sp.]HEX2541280.1 formylglycine-generating enzyme family protein [Caldimonas sp.]
MAGCCGSGAAREGHDATQAGDPASRTLAVGEPAPRSVAALGRGAPAGRWCDIPAGTFTCGNDGADAIAGDGEGPARRLTLGAFRIAATTVTNAEFAAFVRATQHVTDAERLSRSFVFHLQVAEAQRAAAHPVVARTPWWRRVEHACWQRPEGPGSHVLDRPDHPVVHVSWRDAIAYCAWRGVGLPTEAQWERAARGGLEGRRFAWGDELLDADGVPRCNVFRGDFPNAPTAGWRPGPVEAGSGEPNGFGLHHVCGNVWEWCADARDGGERALRGGSFLCHDSYCNRYRVAARSANTRDSAASNIGFRVVSASS